MAARDTAQDGEKMSETQHPSQQPAAEAERQLARATSGYSSSMEVYYEPQRSSYRPVTEQGFKSDASGTPTSLPPATENHSERELQTEEESSSITVMDSSTTKTHITERPTEKSQGTAPGLRENTARHFAKPKPGYNATQKTPYPKKVAEVGMSPTARQLYESTTRNTAQGGLYQSGRKYSATSTGPLPSQVLPPMSIDAEGQGISPAFNVSGQNVQPAYEQEILLHPSATVTNIPTKDPQDKIKAFSQAVSTAIHGFSETQSGHITAPLPHASQAESDQVDQLLTFFDKAREGPSPSLTAYKSHLRTLNPGPNPPSVLIPEQTNQIQPPQSGNLAPSSPAMQQSVSKLLPGSSSVAPDVRQHLNPDVRRTAVAPSNMSPIANSGWYEFPYFHALGLHPTVQGNQFGQQPMPAHSAAPPDNRMAHLAPQTRPHAPTFQIVKQASATQHAGNLTTQFQVATPYDNRIDPGTTQRALQYQEPLSDAHMIPQPTLMPWFVGLPNEMLLAPMPPSHPVLSEEEVAYYKKMAYVQKWLDDCPPADTPEMSQQNQASTQRERAAIGRQGPSNTGSQTVPQNDEQQRVPEADTTGAKTVTPNIAQTNSPEEMKERPSVEPTMQAPQLRSSVYHLRSVEHRISAPQSQVRSQKTRGAVSGRSSGRKQRGRRGEPPMESHATSHGHPTASHQPDPMQSFQGQKRGGPDFDGRGGSSTPRGSFTSERGSNTFRTSASAPRAREETSETPISGSSQPLSRRRSYQPGTSTTSQTETFQFPHMAEQAAEREERRKVEKVSRSLESPARDPQRDAHSKLSYVVETQEQRDTTQEMRRSSHGSEPSKEETSAKRLSQAGPQTPRRRKGIPQKWPTWEAEDAPESRKSPLPAQGETSSLGQEHAVPETEVLPPEQRKYMDESSPEQGRCKEFEPLGPSPFQGTTCVDSDGDSELDFCLQTPLHISPSLLSSPLNFPVPPKDASFSARSPSSIRHIKDCAISTPSLASSEDAQQFKCSAGISFSVASDTSFVDRKPISGTFRLSRRSDDYAVSTANDDADR